MCLGAVAVTVFDGRAYNNCIMKRILALLLLLFTVSAQAASILWVDIRGDISTVNVNGTPYDFRVFMESKSNPNWDASGGIDLIAVTESGEILSWYYGVDYGWDTFGPWVTPEGTGDEYEWSAVSQQIDVTPASDNEKIRIIAGYFDWDNMDEGIETVDLSYYTPLAYTEEYKSALSDYYRWMSGDPGNVGPPSKYWVPTQWNAYGTVIPEPSTAALFLIGTVLLFHKNRTSQRT